MKIKMEAFERNGTWALTSFPLGKKALGCKWVYKIKRKSDRSMEEYKLAWSFSGILGLKD